MPTVTVPRANLTTDEVVTVLRDGLGPDYNVLPGMAMRRLPFLAPHEGRPNKIVVGTGDNRVVKAQVTIIPRGGQTAVRISPGGFTMTFVLNTFGIVRQVRAVLASSPRLSGEAGTPER
jgi:hypothetical protein